jgi:hypothetical protein
MFFQALLTTLTIIGIGPDSGAVFKSEEQRSFCSRGVRQFVSDPFLSETSLKRSSVSRMSFLKWREELGTLLSDEARLYFETKNTYYLEYGDRFFRFNRVRSEHDYSWNVTELRRDFEFPKSKYSKFFIFALRASLPDLGLESDEFIQKHIVQI